MLSSILSFICHTCTFYKGGANIWFWRTEIIPRLFPARIAGLCSLHWLWQTHPNPPPTTPRYNPARSLVTTRCNTHMVWRHYQGLFNGIFFVSAFECKTTVLYRPCEGGSRVNRLKGNLHGNYFPCEETHVSFFPITLAIRGTLLVNTALFPACFFYPKMTHCTQSSTSSLQLGRNYFQFCRTW